MMIGRGLSAWIKLRAAERWTTEDVIISEISRKPVRLPMRWYLMNRRPPMNRIVNRPDLHRIAKDLAVALMIAGAVVLFFL